jgi:hypothetical protein
MFPPIVTRGKQAKKSISSSIERHMNPDFAGSEGAVKGHFILCARGIIERCFMGMISSFIYCLSRGDNGLNSNRRSEKRNE